MKISLDSDFQNEGLTERGRIIRRVQLEAIAEVTISVNHASADEIVDYNLDLRSEIKSYSKLQLKQ